VIDTSENINNIRFGTGSAPRASGMVGWGWCLGTREINFSEGRSKLPWERDCPPGVWVIARAIAT